MSTVDNFASWLCSHPPVTEISRYLVNECFVEFGAVSSRLSKINADGSLSFFSEYGHDEVLLGKSYLASQWKAWREESAQIALNSQTGRWDPERKLVVTVLLDHGIVHGYVVVDFADNVANPQDVLDLLRSFSYPLSLYLVGEAVIGGNSKHDFSVANNAAINVDEAQEILKQLTDRQIKVLKSLSQGKTNLEIAKNLGYSVSTIRHDVMHLFRVLRISARNEAGPRAAELAII